MSSLRTKAVHSLEVLAKAPIRERIVALGEALRVGPEDEREAVALRLFELAAAARSPERNRAAGPIELLGAWPERFRIRHAENAMHAIVRVWDGVPAAARPLTTGLARDRWLRVVARAGAETDPLSRLAAARFAEDTADPGLGRLVCRLLGDEDRAVRLQADRALLRLVMTLVADVPASRLGEELHAVAARPCVRLAADPGVLELERVELCRQVADAAWSYADHRCRAPLLGALLVLDRLPAGVLERPAASRIRRLLNEKHHPSHTPVRTVLRRTPSPLLRERALRWLVIDPMAGACADRLASADSLEEHAITLERAYLAVRPARADRLRAVRAPDRDRSPIPAPRDLPRLPAEARRGLVRFVQLIGLDDETRRAALEPTLADESPLVRFAGAHAAHPTDLSDFNFDADPSVARSAANRWSTVGVPAPAHATPGWRRRSELAVLLARSPHAEVREVAVAERDRLNPFGGTPASRVAARRLRECDPIGFVHAVRAELTDDAGVLPALMLIRALGMAARFEMDLAALAADAPQGRVRATAVAAMAGVNSDAARRTIRAALEEPDPRVRSNAVEALDADAGVLLEYKEDPSHRVRASVVRRVLSHPESTPRVRESAAEALGRMLGDDRPDHRLSGAWAAERVMRPDRRDGFGSGWRPLFKRLCDAAERDGDERVRRRAGRCVRRLDSATGRNSVV